MPYKLPGWSTHQKRADDLDCSREKFITILNKIKVNSLYHASD